MCLFRKKKTNSDRTLESKERLENCVKALKVLSIEFENHADIFDKVNAIIGKLTFVSPKPDTKDLDKKIANKIDDMRIIAEKSIKKNDFTEVETYLKEVRQLIEQR